MPGFENFDPKREVIHCDKPGTGSVDAPRCFSLKLKQVTDRIGMRCCTIDPELCIMHDHRAKGPMGTLIALMTKHVDDLKVCGNKKVVTWILEKIEKVFGQLKIEWHEFTNCGIRHTQDPTTKAIKLDQFEYISKFKIIAHKDLQGRRNEDE